MFATCNELKFLVQRKILWTYTLSVKHVYILVL